MSSGWEPDLAELVNSDHFDDAVTLAEEVMPGLLRECSWEVARALVAGIPEAHRSAQLRVAEAEAALMLGESSGNQIESAKSAIAADVELAWWLMAIEAEWHLSRLDVTLACATAAQALAEMPQDLILPMPVLRARARCRRLVAIALLATGDTAQVGQADELISGALADLRRAELEEEPAITTALVAIVKLVLTWDDPHGSLNRIREARDLLAARGSRWRESAQLGVLVCSLFVGDMVEFNAALGGLDDNEHITTPLASLLIAYLCAIRDLVVAGGEVEALVAFEPVLTTVRESYPPLLAPLFTHLVSICADFGRTAAAAEWADRLATTLPSTPARSWSVRLSRRGSGYSAATRTLRPESRARWTACVPRATNAMPAFRPSGLPATASGAGSGRMPSGCGSSGSTCSRSRTSRGGRKRGRFGSNFGHSRSTAHLRSPAKPPFPQHALAGGAWTSGY